MADSASVGYVPMTSIAKKPDSKYIKQTSNWVATEKIHGSSFQFYTNDGCAVGVGSRTRNLDREGSFLKCNVKYLLKEYEDCVLKLWQIVNSQDRWATYAEAFDGYDSDNEDGGDEGGDDDAQTENNDKDNDIDDVTSREQCYVRVYGELYGGGGIDKDIKSAVQKEIIYCDDFRFYVFGLTINQKWVTVSELVDLCKEAGFPYYAKPVCETRPTLEGLKEHLLESGLMRGRSSFTDKTDDEKTAIEGVVMTPLTRPDFRLHAVKFLSPAFNDVKEAQFGKTKTANYCTKQRFHSVISKLDTHERENTQMVVDLFIADIIKESPDKNPNDKMKGIWARLVMQWLTEDDINTTDGGGWKDSKTIKNEKRQQEKKAMAAKHQQRREEARENREKRKVEEEKEEDGDFGLGLFDS